MSQLNLNKFFIITHTVTNKKKYFIYIPHEKRAIYTNKTEAEDKFVIKKCGLHLYIREKTERTRWNPTVLDNINIPLIKSNLQKAVRRKDFDIACQSLLYLLEKDKISVLRRLPIIMIEDTVLFDKIEIIVWLMIANKEYLLREDDIEILLLILKNMIETKSYFDYESINDVINPMNDINIEEIHISSVRALSYREKYGGMKGDINLIHKAINYYLKNENKIEHIIDFNMKPVLNKYKIIENVDIIWEAIDFHCYPYILQRISNRTHFSREMIKEYIWYCHSAINVRKPRTKRTSEKMKKKQEWKIIEKELEIERNLYIDKL